MAFWTSRVLWKKASHARRKRKRGRPAVQELAKCEATAHKEKGSQQEVKLSGEMETNMGDFNLLPEDCFAHIISFTSPRHACILSLVSSCFRSGVDSDAIWERFLPSDYVSLLSRAVQPVQYASKKELYMRLCDHPVQIDGGKLSFGLKKSTGAKCFTIPACEMNMPGYEDYKYWKIISVSNSRFPKAVKLTHNVTGRDTHISGRIDSKVLSSHTIYASYLIFRINEAINIEATSFLLSTVIINGLSVCKQRVFLRPPQEPIEFSQHQCQLYLFYEGECTLDMFYERECTLDIKWPKKRIDGWMEVEMGQFYNENWNDQEIEISLKVVHHYIPAGIIFLGIEH